MTENERQSGMQNKNFDHTFDAMLFHQNSGYHCFWMKDCIIPLDIIFIENGKISKIYKNCKECDYEDCESYCGNGNLVLEILGGRCDELGIEEGDDIYITI